MGSAVKITTIGNSAGIILSRETMAKLKVKKGDMLYMSETQDGIHLAPYDPAFAKKMEMLEEVMQENRDVLRQLAK